MGKATTVSEICCSTTKSQDEFPNVDNSSLLMTLLEDSQVEDGDDERLRIVIQSLEAEIIDQESCSETGIKSDDHMEDEIQQMDSCSTSPDHLDFEWIDEEIMDYYCPNNDYYMTGYFIGGFADYNMENTNDFVGERDYSLICYEIGMIEEEDYGGLWQ